MSPITIFGAGLMQQMLGVKMYSSFEIHFITYHLELDTSHVTQLSATSQKELPCGPLTPTPSQAGHRCQGPAPAITWAPQG